MDPSNFGSFSSGGNSGGAGVPGVPNDGVTTGANPVADSSQPNPVQPQGLVGMQPQMMQPQVQQPMQFQPQPVSSGMGDITLNSDEPVKKPRKGLAFGVIAGLILIICAVVGVWAAVSLNKKTTDGKQYADVSFEDFVSYMVSGDDKTNYDVSTFNAMQNYAIDNFFEKSGTEEAANYFEKLNGLWQSFVERQDFDSSNWNGAEVISSDLGTLAVYMRRRATSEETLLQQYIKEGEGSLYADNSDEYNDNYKPSDALLSYMAFWDDYTNSLIELFKSYIKNGCVVNNKIDYECVENKGIYSQNAYSQLKFAEENLVDDAADIEYEIKWRVEKIVTSGEGIE